MNKQTQPVNATKGQLAGIFVIAFAVGFTATTVAIQLGAFILSLVFSDGDSLIEDSVDAMEDVSQDQRY